MKRSCQRHTGLRLTGLAHDLVGSDAVRAQQHALGPPDMLVGGVASRASAARRRRLAGLRVMESGSHALDSHVSSSPGIPYEIQMSDLIH